MRCGCVEAVTAEKVEQAGDGAVQDFARYRADPVAYAQEVLGVRWWERQREVARNLLQYKRVFVKASHSVGKSFLAGGLVNWFFDCFDPGLCITTAPNAKQVKDILWKEIRSQRPRSLRCALLPRACRMETSPDHFAVGYTARDDSGFQGRHAEHVLIIFDEATGVDAPFWDAAEGMMTGEHCYWLAILNPTDPTSRAYEECQNTSKWHVMEISALEHPNIMADLVGTPAPFPKAVRLEWVWGRIREWCSPVEAADRHARDFEFPPGGAQWYRPGSLFESKVLGLWPTQGSASVWNEATWLMCLQPQPMVMTSPLELGCDKARFGDDFTSIVARRGNCVLHHETHNGWDNNQIAGRLKQLCETFAHLAEDARQVAVRIDDVQGAVVDLADGYGFCVVNSSSRAADEAEFPNKRTELWFAASERAAEGRVDLSRLTDDSRNLLRAQAMAPTWKVDAQGRRVVEPKSDTKRRLARSPDDMDALNLAFYAYADGGDWQEARQAVSALYTPTPSGSDLW